MRCSPTFEWKVLCQVYTSSMCGSPQTATALAQITSWSEKKVYFKLHESGVLFPIKEVNYVLNMQIAHYTDSHVHLET